MVFTDANHDWMVGTGVIGDARILAYTASSDSIPPTTTASAVTYYASSATIHLTATDNAGGSGVAHTYYTLNGGAQVEGTTITTSTAGTYTLVYWSVDAAGNVESSKTASFLVTKMATAASIKSSTAKTYHGRTITLSGTLKNGKRGGRVRLYIRKSGHSWTYKTVTLTSTAWSYKYKFSRSTRAKGTYHFYISYAGDASRLSSKSSQRKVTVIR